MLISTTYNSERSEESHLTPPQDRVIAKLAEQTVNYLINF